MTDQESGSLRDEPIDFVPSERALDIALEVDKQIIAISTAVLALTAVFLDNVAGLSGGERVLLGASWCLFAFAAALGLIVFMISAGALTKHAPASVAVRGDVRRMAGAQIIVFGLAVGVMVVFALARLCR